MRVRSISVSFHLAVHRSGPPWPDGRFQAAEALQVIRDLPADRRRMQHGRFFEEKVGNVTGEPPFPLLSVENVEVGARIRIAQKGALGTHQFDEDSGPAEPTYSMFFDDNIVGMVRLPGGPPPDTIATYLAVVAGYDLKLVPIQDPRVAERLDRPASDFKKLKLTAVAGRGSRIAAASKLGDIFKAAEEASPGVEEITVILSMRTTKKAARTRWWNGAGPQVEALINDPEALQQFGDASVTAEGEGRVDLLEDLIVWKDRVPADEQKHIDEQTIARAITDAYRKNERRLRFALGFGE